MKTQPPFHRTLLISCVLSATAGCSGQRPKETVATIQPDAASTAPASPETMPTAPTDPLIEMSVALQSATREKASDLASAQAHMDQGIDEQIATWKAQGKAVTGNSADQLTLARGDFADKLKTLAAATPETWTNNKETALVSLQNLKTAYADFKSAAADS